MANKHRGEIDATLDGRQYTLCLTLGGLAELEAAFGHSDMVALAQRFQSGRLSAADCIRIIGCGLRSAGHDVSDETVAAMKIEGGIANCVAIVARLLEATFGANNSSASQSRGEVRDGAIPFPGTT